MANCKWEGRITVPTGGWDITVAEDSAARSDTVTIAAGDYYLTSSTSLLTALKNALDGSGTLLGTYTVTLDDTSDTATGKVTISVAGGASTFAVSTWDDTDLRDALGFTGTTADAASATGGSQALYLWLPNVNRQGTSPEIAATGDNFGMARTDGSYVRSPSGVASGLYFNTQRHDTFIYSNLQAIKVWKLHESTTNESLETFWENVIRKFLPFRYHPDRSDDSVYATLRVTDSGNSFAPAPQVESWVGSSSLWQWQCDVDEYVAP